MGLYNYIDKNNLFKLMQIDLYNRCRFIVTVLFLDKKDKNNQPYINHLIRVSDRMKTEDGKIAGLLHDVVEDIEGITFEDLSTIGVNDDIIEALKLVTNEKTDKELTKSEKIEIYNKKIVKIINSGNKLAIELKYNDMLDNYNEERLSTLPDDKQEWFKLKYGENIKKLRKVNIEES